MYLRIQAGHLADVGKMETTIAARTLLDLAISEFPDDLQLAIAYAQRAKISFAEGRHEDALADYRFALERERQFPNIKTAAWIDFGWLVVTAKYRALFDEALSVLDERQSEAIFPVDLFRSNAIRSLIAEDRGAITDARRFASVALQHAGCLHSGMFYHPKVGLVGTEYASTVQRLQEISKR